MSKRNIEESAIFIADAHYPHYGDLFLIILESLNSGKINTPQLFLMGDIFDLLFGHSKYIKTFSNQAITLLQQLSKEIDIYYMEGNHDFCLKEIFPYIKIYSRKQQPIEFKLNGRDVYLSHGDLYQTTVLYNIYSRLLRSRFTLTILLPFEKQIIDYQIRKLKSKDICYELIDFKLKVDRIKEKYPRNSLIVEGHFHQGKIFNNYISLPSLACQKKIAIVKCGELVFIDTPPSKGWELWF